ncbi:hypothetical protein AB2N08_17650 [Massilia aurea]|uniref:hypothetical protein n=1 Tax=Massilia aurea TaxID=373040 RepID=UPI0034635424
MSNSTTYKQEVKEKSRIEIWSNAVKKLTIEREHQRILNPNYIRRLWDYAFDEILPDKLDRDPDERFIESWTDFSNNSYEKKQPQQLKVAYFCGPEPENDLTIMTDLGILVENVWAIESDKEIYHSALTKAKKTYPTLKIFNGSISDLLKITSFKFDIIYLDFTAPLFSKQSKPLLTINSVFENNSLSDLGILVINSCVPDATEENIEFLASYFRSQPFLESDVLLGPEKSGFFAEGADTYGFIDQESYDCAVAEGDFEYVKDQPIYENAIRSNFGAAYSAFSSHYPVMIAGYMQPMWRIANNPSLKRMLLKIDDPKIRACIEKMMTLRDYESEESDMTEELEDKFQVSGGEVFENHQEFPIWNFMLRLKESKNAVSKYWYEQFSRKNGAASLLESVQLYDLLRNAQYSYKETLSEMLSDSIDQVISALPDPHGGIFCDVPMEHLWIELAINHMGNSYHANTNQHWRAKYQAKSREMYLDMFVFDNCRSLYNWLPMINLYGQDMASIERQIIVRSCMDAITKQNHYSAFFSYYGANLIGVNSKRWSDFGELIARKDLNLKPVSLLDDDPGSSLAPSSLA